ncbi:coiled-coil domain-containing protein 32 [Erpetoichthys calabaricus]|uniref:coiled-coil domain-containing protein 32 n=1 Tax=Erpetoichthys calabaricus TaxID=27687 RepID=UPI002234C0E1|nr:coiled-coil domain-containing protein 32 [Erpetoichthys calabaricus]
MIDSFDSCGVQSSGDLWAQICSTLPSTNNDAGSTEEVFTDSFQPEPILSVCEGQVENGHPQTSTSMASFNMFQNTWAPMPDSEVYIASLENRLRRIKGQTQEVTSQGMLRTLSQAKKECWDRFLHEAEESHLYQEGNDLDQSALEQLRRWLQPEKVAISAEELQALLQPEPPHLCFEHLEQNDQKEEGGETDKEESQVAEK